MHATPRTEDIVTLLAGTGASAEFRLTCLAGGANNRVYRVDSDVGPLLLKAYFRHPDDPRDRLGAEFSFSRFAWEHGLRCLARPLACDQTHDLGLYEFIEGRKLSPGEVGADEVRQAVDFHRALNRHKFGSRARELSRGSEACFTLGEHLACVETRMARLLQFDGATSLDRDAVLLIRADLAPAWAQIRQSTLDQALEMALPINDPIALADECLSPSDFGFHNAIRAIDGSLRFIDFEYAGWDDPAKTVCDFFCQPAVPVPVSLASEFAHSLVSDLSNPELHLRRIDLLQPVYRLKWCCIMLNEFLPTGGRRRSFAHDAEGDNAVGDNAVGDNAEGDAARKRAQLQKAGQALRQLHH